MFKENEKSVRSIREKIRNAEQQLAEFIHFLSTKGDNRKRTLIELGEVPGRGFSLLEVSVEAQRTARAILSLRTPRFANLSVDRLNGLLNASGSLETATLQLSNATAQLLGDNRSFLFGEGGRVLTFLTREEIYNFAPLAEGVFSSLEALRSAATGLGLTPSDAQAEERVADTIAELTERAALSARKIQQHQDAVASAKDNAEAKLSEFDELSQKLTNDANTLAEDLRQKTSTISTLSESASSSVDAIRSHEEQASTLREKALELTQAAETDRSRLAEFAAELSQTQGELSELRGIANAGKLQQDEYLAQAEALIKRAEEMVSGATVAGLAKAFADERSDLEKGMKNAMTWFFIGIAFLFLVTILLAAYVFEIPFTVWGIALSGGGETDAVGDEVTVAGVLSRTIILVAPFWLTLFSARRYRNLFDLRQQYSHKYNLAFSIDGFKKQAPTYGEDLTAWVFHAISQMPTTAASRKMGDNPIPTLEAMIAATVERTGLFRTRRDEPSE